MNLLYHAMFILIVRRHHHVIIFLESVASELASRMTAMQSASNNAKKIVAVLSQVYNRARQASVTQEMLEIVAGASSASE